MENGSEGALVFCLGLLISVLVYGNAVLAVVGVLSACLVLRWLLLLLAFPSLTTSIACFIVVA